MLLELAMRALVCGLILGIASLGATLDGQQRRPASPEGTSATQVNGRWLEIVYGRPILRGRTAIFGSGADYGKTLFDGGTVWRAGANTSTRLKNEVTLDVGGKRVAPGEYVMLIDLKNDKDWTLILTSQPYTAIFDPKNTKELYGGFNYRPEHDVARAPMTVEKLPYAVDQLRWVFSEVAPCGGAVGIMWGLMMACAPC